MTHPDPNENMLFPYMHPNIAQITRVWVAATLLSGTFMLPDEPTDMAPHDMISSMIAKSQASSIIQWDKAQGDRLPTPDTINFSSPTETHFTLAGQVLSLSQEDIIPAFQQLHRPMELLEAPHNNAAKLPTYTNPYKRNTTNRINGRFCDDNLDPLLGQGIVEIKGSLLDYSSLI